MCVCGGGECMQLSTGLRVGLWLSLFMLGGVTTEAEVICFGLLTGFFVGIIMVA